MFRPLLAVALSAAAVAATVVPISPAAALPLAFPSTYSGTGKPLGAVVAYFQNQNTGVVMGCQVSTIAGARNTTTGRPLTITQLAFPLPAGKVCSYPSGGSFAVTALGLPWTVTGSAATGIRIRVVSLSTIPMSCTFELGGIGGTSTGSVSAVYSGSTFRLTGMLEVAAGGGCPTYFDPGDPVYFEAPFTI